MGKQEVGDWGEDLATKFLQKKGYRIRERNFQTRFGEIDIIAEKDDVLVIIEVKTRKTDYFGSPEEFVTPEKQAKIKRTALEYLEKNPFSNWRIDVISVITEPESQIEHFENITA